LPPPARSVVLVGSLRSHVRRGGQVADKPGGCHLCHALEGAGLFEQTVCTREHSQLLDVPARSAASGTCEHMWQDRPVPHNVTFSGFASPTQGSGSYSHTFASAGMFHYTCTIHTNMTGTVTVTGSRTQRRQGIVSSVKRPGDAMRHALAIAVVRSSPNSGSEDLGSTQWWAFLLTRCRGGLATTITTTGSRRRPPCGAQL
jgi:hypothetical protein